MISIHAGISINHPDVKAFDMSKLQTISMSETSEENYQRFIGMQEKSLEMRHSQPANTSQNPAYKEYATVKVNGKTVAKIDNHGFVETSNALGGKLQNLFSDEGTGLNGPQLAQQRAEKIAALLGGKVEKSSTAMSQAQFNAIPQPHSTIDYQAIKEDPAYEQLQKTKEARTLFLAQQVAQESAQATAPAEKASLDTNHGEEPLNIDNLYNPTGHSGPIDLDKIPLLLPTARNIEALSGHASVKFQELLNSYGISEGPEQITFDSYGQIELPDGYPYSDELKQALKENPGLERELHDITALTSHYAGIQAALRSNGSNRAYAEIALNFGADGKIGVTANGEPYDASDDKKVNLTVDPAQPAASSDAGESTESASNDSDAVTAFLDYMSKTPEERYYEALLAEEDLTKEELAALPPEERAKIEAKIQATIQAKIMEHMVSTTAEDTNVNSPN